MTKSKGLYERHGMRRTKIYAVWRSMRSRCENANAEFYADYGGRGITVCPEWKKFSAFYRDMGEPPEGMTLERRDNDKGYSRENCRWATRAEQSRNQRSNLRITIGDETLPLADWAVRYGIKYATVHQRIRKGWLPYFAVTTPLVTKRKGIPRGERVGTFGADPTLIQPEQPAARRAA